MRETVAFSFVWLILVFGDILVLLTLPLFHDVWSCHAVRSLIPVCSLLPHLLCTATGNYLTWIYIIGQHIIIVICHLTIVLYYVKFVIRWSTAVNNSLEFTVTKHRSEILVHDHKSAQCGRPLNSVVNHSIMVAVYLSIKRCCKKIMDKKVTSV